MQNFVKRNARKPPKSAYYKSLFFKNLVHDG